MKTMCESGKIISPTIMSALKRMILITPIPTHLHLLLVSEASWQAIAARRLLLGKAQDKQAIPNTH
jgi:hypothetical protein